MKTFLIIIVILGLGYFAWKAIQTKPDPNIPQATVSDTTEENQDTTVITTDANSAVNNEAVSVTFKGFGPGKEHNGSFSKVNSNLSFNSDGNLEGSIVVDMSSMSTDNEEKLTPHLKSKDFFDVAKYPTATFTLKGLTPQSTTATGSFAIHGVTKDVSFPISFSSSTKSYTANFNIDMKEFGINQTFANEIIELSVVVPLK